MRGDFESVVHDFVHWYPSHANSRFHHGSIPLKSESQYSYTGTLALWIDFCDLYNSPHVFTGGTLHMVCRNKDKAEEARADIVKETGNKVSLKGPNATL